jgi:hypothetical protein
MVLRSGVLGGGKNGISVLRMRWKRTPWSLSSLLPFHYTRVGTVFVFSRGFSSKMAFWKQKASPCKTPNLPAPGS